MRGRDWNADASPRDRQEEEHSRRRGRQGLNLSLREASLAALRGAVELAGAAARGAGREVPRASFPASALLVNVPQFLFLSNLSLVRKVNL